MESVFLYETLLFYRHSPCYYKLYETDEFYVGEPTPHHYYSKINFPHFIIRKVRNTWMVEGIDDPNMVKKILQEFEDYISKAIAC
jgi:hypothetical protein